jgi:parvulin-like peptidyl-prolyl isomerase
MISNSPRRILVSLLALGTLVLAGCGGVASTDALRVGSQSISADFLDTILTQLGDAGQITIENGQVAPDASRSVLNALYRGEATKELLANYGEEVTEADRTKVRTQVSQDPAFSNLGEDLQDLIISLNAGDLALARLSAPSEKDLQAMYESSPASLGMMCVAHLVVEEESTARKALDEVNAGAKFADVAGKYSIEPGADKSGGVLGSEDGDCIPLADYQTQFDKDFVAGALTAKAGVPTGPVKSSFGYHVIYVRPFDDVKLSATTLMKTNPGEFLISGFMATADVKVGSKYGRYNPATGTFVAN